MCLFTSQVPTSSAAAYPRGSCTSTVVEILEEVNFDLVIVQMCRWFVIVHTFSTVQCCIRLCNVVYLVQYILQHSVKNNAYTYTVQ